MNLRDESGQTLVEFALSFVIFIITTFGIIEFGIAVYQYNMMANLAQEGARWASVRGVRSTCSPGCPASASDVQTFVQSRALGMTVTVTTSPDPSGLAPGSTVSVQVQTLYTPLTGLIPHTQLTLRSTAQMTMTR